MTVTSRVWRVPALALLLGLAATACNGHLDFGVGGGTGGISGAGACAGDTDCHLPSLHCDLAGSRTCVACTGDDQCLTAGARHCDPVLRRCVACVLGTDCAATEACVAGRCLIACKEDTPPACPGTTSCHSGVCGTCGDDDATVCPSLPATPFCLSAAGICVGCRTDLDCSGAVPRCDPVNKTCVQCALGIDCPAATPFCDPRTGTCSAG